MGICIWCKNEVKKFSVEHIIPEPIGCPKDFHLEKGDICNPCNNKLSKLDQAVIDEFDIASFMAGIPRKRNKTPLINNRGNLVGKYTEEGKAVFVNMERNSINAIDSTHLSKYGKSPRNIRAKFKRDGQIAEVSFQTSFGNSPKFVRGIYKIAFSSLVYFLGSKLALKREFDSIRNYVLYGKGKRKIIYKPCSDESYKNRVWPPYLKNQNEYVVVMRIAFVEISVDLSPKSTVFPSLLKELKKHHGDHGWGYLPI